ncbi:hypothetical protein PHYSODRAFT_471977 [Phytophthora sojae]|uniref:Crinkler effector protein N-terminal domain-containing protein n=1 Tax=Phytophthora sojae (strain P6497) TaxID=1094619 RepID=G4YHW2_PHYSP|nr:hypothetical protein PHYSODRAFT_471977 [Phytophthora sojae]EGZ29689.1 hypothetical protein PHYSODRAFT_471977 [Phytophthora sojae]|eukprot:XP_009516964.1 hypothetical protein PHYSODRAFT_471977 [Phytophthora sojae]
MRLICALPGLTTSLFTAETDLNDMVCDLKLYIKAQNSAKIKCDAGDLKIFSASTRNSWLSDDAMLALEEG